MVRAPYVQATLRAVPGRPSLLAMPGLVAALLLGGCGHDRPHQPDGPRAVVEQFGRASASHDYQQICDRLIAPVLAAKVEQVGLPCELAFKKGLNAVRAPRISIGLIRVIGATAYVRVHSTAANQAPSDDTLKLVRTGKAWRIVALTSTLPPVPQTAPIAPTQTTAPSSVPPGAFPTG
jgi:hypothetical protein